RQLPRTLSQLGGSVSLASWATETSEAGPSTGPPNWHRPLRVNLAGRKHVWPAPAWLRRSSVTARKIPAGGGPQVARERTRAATATQHTELGTGGVAVDPLGLTTTRLDARIVSPGFLLRMAQQRLVISNPSRWGCISRSSTSLEGLVASMRQPRSAYPGALSPLASRSARRAPAWTRWR